MAFLPIPITILVLVLKAVQDKGKAQPSSVVVDEDPEEREGEKSPEARTEKGTTPPRIKGEPATGFGPAPVSEREILVTACIIILPSILMTWEQGIRTAQVFYRPVPGQPQPWVSPSCCHSLVWTACSPYPPVHVQGDLLGLNICCRVDCCPYSWICSSSSPI